MATVGLACVAMAAVLVVMAPRAVRRFAGAEQPINEEVHAMAVWLSAVSGNALVAINKLLYARPG